MRRTGENSASLNLSPPPERGRNPSKHRLARSKYILRVKLVMKSISTGLQIPSIHCPTTHRLRNILPGRLLHRIWISDLFMSLAKIRMPRVVTSRFRVWGPELILPASTRNKNQSAWWNSQTGTIVDRWLRRLSPSSAHCQALGQCLNASSPQQFRSI